MSPSPNRKPTSRAARQAALPTVAYAEDVPVSEHRADIAAAVAAHQVVIVAGETASGKTTQLPNGRAHRRRARHPAGGGGGLQVRSLICACTT
ncbi:MAG: hypothetical protein M3063_11635 [Actinomycetota bacterium]|nr:hypothetical protein [Actinomycetota bacterium]